jgi:parallel beta-helix repeat protein
MSNNTWFIPAAMLITAVFVPAPTVAQPLLVVTPTSVTAQTTVGANAASQTVQVSNGGNRALKWSVVQPTATWLSVSPSSGTNNAPLTLTFSTSALAAGPYQTSFRVEDRTGGQVTVNVQLTVSGTSQPPQLTVTCPSNFSVASPDGSPVVVTYSATTSGGNPPVTWTGTPPSGSSFAVGPTAVQVTAQSGDGQTATCGFTVTVTFTPSSDWTFCANEGQFCAFSGTRQVRYGANGSYFIQTLTDGTACSNAVFGDPIFGTAKHCDYGPLISSPPPTGLGPQPLTCPAGAVEIAPGTNIQSLVNLHPGTTTFCLKTGLHTISSSISPKTGNTFLGELGAIIDGTGWTSADDTEAAFRAHNQDVDSVTIRNLTIRNLRRAVHAYYTQSSNWTIENNDIGPNQWGILFPSGSSIRNNIIHDNSAGGYLGVFANNSIVEDNEIARNGPEQKIGESANVIIRNNFVHHNLGDGIWFDNNNTGVLIEGNVVEDNKHMGIFYEISTNAIIRNNTIKRTGDTAVFISTSKNTEVHHNTLEENFRGITYFVNCSSVGGGTIPGGFDLSDNSVHDNTIVIGTQQVDAFAAVFSYTLCTSAQVALYENGSKNLKFLNNTYDVPFPTTGRYWFWNALKYWNEWQALGHDLTGTVK